ncbi:MAG: heavy-metal-associated domain-containing protein [Candidatus Nanohalobium sp.]
MTDSKIEIELDEISLAGGLLGGILFAAPNLAPFILKATTSAILASRSMIFQILGASVGLGTLFLSIDWSRGGKLSMKSLYSAIIPFLALAIIGFSAVPFASAIGTSGNSKVTGENLKVVKLDVEGMICQGCRLTVKNYLQALDGTEKVTASLTKKQATVIYNSEKISAESIASSKVFRGAYSATISTVQKYQGG